MSARIYITALPEDECLRRLQSRAHSVGWMSWAKGTILTKIRGHRFRVFACGQEGIRNSFALAFYGRLEKVPDGTRISGWFRMHLFTRLFLAVWFGGLVWMMGLILFLPASSWGGQAPAAFLAFGPAVMILMGIGLLALNRRFEQYQADCVSRFLEQDLEAHLWNSRGPNQGASPIGGVGMPGNSGQGDRPPSVS